MNHGPNVKYKTIKLLDNNMGDLGLQGLGL